MTCRCAQSSVVPLKRPAGAGELASEHQASAVTYCLLHSCWRQMKKKIAIHAEDYDLAKKFKLQIQKLEKSLEPPPPPRPPPPPPPTPLSELSTEERHAKRVGSASAYRIDQHILHLHVQMRSSSRPCGYIIIGGGGAQRHHKLSG